MLNNKNYIDEEVRNQDEEEISNNVNCINEERRNQNDEEILNNENCIDEESRQKGEEEIFNNENCNADESEPIIRTGKIHRNLYSLRKRSVDNSQLQKMKADRIFYCDNCEKQFTQKRHLNRHIQSIHEGIKYDCDLCDYQASRQDQLKTHLQTKHYGSFDSNLYKLRVSLEESSDVPVVLRPIVF